MKKRLVFAMVMVAGIVFVQGCKSDANSQLAVSDFTGNQSVYALVAASAYPISGTVTFKERKDGGTSIVIALTGVTDTDQHPVHLHLGDIATDKALVAAQLEPVAGKNGESSTILTKLADESTVTYKELIKLSACVKVHLASVGAEADVILAAGNVGSAAANSTPGGRLGIAVCSSK